MGAGVLIALAACSGSSDPPSASSTPGTTTIVPTTPSTTSARAQPDTTTIPPTSAPATIVAEREPFVPPTVPLLRVTGPEEVVFDWDVDACEPENIPDIAPRALRDASGTTQLIVGHYVNYRMVGPDLASVVPDCTPIYRSAFDPDPSMFDDSTWIGSPYTLDGTTVYAVAHHEYRGDTHDAVRPGQCPSSQRFICLDTSLVLLVSHDGGATYAPAAPPPAHLVASMPYVFDDEGLPTGLRQPSNIIRGPGDFYYLLVNASAVPEVRHGIDTDQWVCLLRTDDLGDPASWRYWTGSDFTGVFTNPYLTPPGDDPDLCAPIDVHALGPSLTDSVVYVEPIGQYVLTGIWAHPITRDPWGVYFSFSSDLIHWSTRRLLIELPTYNNVADTATDELYAFPSLIDPDSPSANFETTDGTAYVYLQHVRGSGNSLDRDLVRFPVELVLDPIPPADWTFDIDGAADGWRVVNALTPSVVAGGVLSTTSTGEDPILAVEGLQLPAAYSTVTVRMKVVGAPTTGLVFFTTDTTPDFGVDYASFEVITDGEFHDYELDLSAAPTWNGTITALRLDPVEYGGSDIEIDRIWFSAG